MFYRILFHAINLMNTFHSTAQWIWVCTLIEQWPGYLGHWMHKTLVSTAMTQIYKWAIVCSQFLSSVYFNHYFRSPLFSTAMVTDLLAGCRLGVDWWFHLVKSLTVTRISFTAYIVIALIFFSSVKFDHYFLGYNCCAYLCHQIVFSWNCIIFLFFQF